MAPARHVIATAPAPDIPRSPVFRQALKGNHEYPGSPGRVTNGINHSGPEPSLSFDGFDCTPGLTEDSRARPTTSRSMRSRISDISLAESTESLTTSATSLLPALQIKDVAEEDLLPLQDEDLDPGSFDIVAPTTHERGAYSLARRSELLFSDKHMAIILKDSRLLGQFTRFLATVRPASLALLTYYLDTEKAIRAIKFANSIAAGLSRLNDYGFTSSVAEDTVNRDLEAKHDAAFQSLVRDELPMFITHTWIRIVSLSVKQRIVGTLSAALRDASEGLAEVFCLTDPSRRDNPIILASKEFHRTTQYGISDVIGRNCRFLQGPGTNPLSIQRIRDKLLAGQEHFETFLNYRRDGSPFMNLLLCAPLIDSRGTVRYFLGAQIDVSGLARDCTDLDGLKRLVQAEKEEANREEDSDDAREGRTEETQRSSAQCCRDLSELFDRNEIEMVRRYGGAMHQMRDEDEVSRQSGSWNTPYLVIEDGTSPQQSPQPEDTVPDLPTIGPKQHPLHAAPQGPSGRLTGVYEHYLLVRPAPSFQILFASPSLRVPGILQSPFLSRIGGSGRVRDQIAQALSEGRGVTAKVRWLTSTSARRYSLNSGRGRPRWLHCTPLHGVNGAIGIWMIVIVDDDVSHMGSGGGGGGGGGGAAHDSAQRQHAPGQRPRLAPVIESHANRKPASFMTEDGSWPTWQH
ncbi:PAS-associated [Moelleriella libera RCEF 2490]|uniref:PAS-associated n=1 Tax=Moelleriella libera RCEF 2490 TaxID=1081109 RepID=A0A168AB24_9HYPO|nr:PAS-associated [Moelleriella libera RCEF 2490]